MAASRPFTIIAGVGSGTGSALARRFAKSYAIVVLARNPHNYQDVVDDINSSGGKAVGIGADVTDPSSVQSAFGQIATEFGESSLAASIYNVGGGFSTKPFLDLTLDEFTRGFGSNAVGAFNFSQAALPLLLKSTHLQHPPSLIFTGATASVKANANVASFAVGKHALRALSQSLAKEFGPKGVHVGHAIIDGVIDVPATKGLSVGESTDSKIDPVAIADAYWHLHTQPRTAWTYEMDIRPYVEKW